MEDDSAIDGMNPNPYENPLRLRGDSLVADYHPPSRASSVPIKSSGVMTQDDKMEATASNTEYEDVHFTSNEHIHPGNDYVQPGPTEAPYMTMLPDAKVSKASSAAIIGDNYYVVEDCTRKKPVTVLDVTKTGLKASCDTYFTLTTDSRVESMYQSLDETPDRRSSDSRRGSKPLGYDERQECENTSHRQSHSRTGSTTIRRIAESEVQKGKVVVTR